MSHDALVEWTAAKLAKRFHPELLASHSVRLTAERRHQPDRILQVFTASVTKDHMPCTVLTGSRFTDLCRLSLGPQPRASPLEGD